MGTLEVTTKKDSAKVTKITIDVTGNTNIKFDDKYKAGKNRTVTKAFKTDLDFYHELITVEGESVLTAGTKTYQYSFTLPNNLMSSFTGEFGA